MKLGSTVVGKKMTMGEYVIMCRCRRAVLAEVICSRMKKSYFFQKKKEKKAYRVGRKKFPGEP
jgi:hypothetical protein